MYNHNSRIYLFPKQMSYLKSKISRALQKSQAPQEIQVKSEFSDSSIAVKQEPLAQVKTEPAPVKSVPKTVRSPPNRDKSNKNIIKNYARAMVNFAMSKMALPYLKKILRQEEVDLEGFRDYMTKNREEVTSIKTLRELLLIEEGEESQVAGYKRAFVKISVVFVKFFSVNWIYNSKVSDKLTHLKYRFKVLRRIKEPEHFTYLEGFTKNR